MADVKRTFPETGMQGLERNLHGVDPSKEHDAARGDMEASGLTDFGLARDINYELRQPRTLSAAPA